MFIYLLPIIVLFGIAFLIPVNSQNFGGQQEYHSICGVNHKVNVGDILKFSDKHPVNKNYKAETIKTKSFSENSLRNKYDSVDEQFQNHYLNTQPLSDGAWESELNVHYMPTSPMENSGPQYMNDQYQVSSDRSTVPLLFSGYFKSPDSSSKSRSIRTGTSSGVNSDAKKFVNIFNLMKHGSFTRNRRSLKDTRKEYSNNGNIGHSLNSNNNNKRCILKFSVGHNCKNLITHMTSGDAAGMNCNNEFLRFKNENGIQQYCDTNRVQKTEEHGNYLEIEHFKKTGIAGQSFQGYVICK